MPIYISSRAEPDTLMGIDHSPEGCLLGDL